MTIFEAEVHSYLRTFLREYETTNWIHHLTMARIVSRTLRLRRSALIQTGNTVSRYSFSYLTPALVSKESVILVLSQSLQKRFLDSEIPQLQKTLNLNKPVYIDSAFAEQELPGLILISPELWLSDRLENQGNLPDNTVTLIEQASEVEHWTRSYLTKSIFPAEWQDLTSNNPSQEELIRELRIKLTQSIFRHPKNPYSCCLLDELEREYLQELFNKLENPTSVFTKFSQQWHQEEAQIIWASVNYELGNFTLHSSPIVVSHYLKSIWQKQPVVLMDGFLSSDKEAILYRQELGLDDLLCLKFAPSRTQEYINLYLPRNLPLPNTPQFQKVLIEQLLDLVNIASSVNRPIVILVEDTPLKTQVGSKLAGEFGKRVVVENRQLAENGVLVCSWGFWHQYQEQFATPQILVIATLPIPSMENPLVAARVAYYKHQHQDWFRLYLLPTALNKLQRAVMPLRESQGIVAILDSRVNLRSYGTQILTALTPYAKIDYIEPIWLS